MPHPVYQKSLVMHLPKWQKRRARAIDPVWFEAALFLFRVNLDPLSEGLEKLYSPSSRGRKHRDPVVMLRALILMTAIGQKSITRFASDLRRKPRLAIIAGFDPRDTPSVGAFYQFIDRLQDGPFQPECTHRVLPSKLRKRPALRNLGQEKADREALRNEILTKSDTITAKLKQDLLASTDRPRNLLSRLEDLLLKAAVIPSARRGMLGDLDKLVVCGDGSALVSGAGCYGKPSCRCRKQGIYKCEHPRFYPDHTANWGWDSYRDVFYFGHTFYQHIVNFGGHDLPVHLDIGPASESDHTLSIKSLDRFLKAAAENALSISISAAVYDAGHDSPKFRELMKLRSGCERSNSVKKVTYKLDRRPCRSATHYLVRLYLISIIEHARAWLAEDRKVFGNDICKLVDPELIK